MKKKIDFFAIICKNTQIGLALLSNNEYFEYFIDFVKNNDKREILKEFGGANIYIPSYKTLLRDEELKQDLKH